MNSGISQRRSMLRRIPVAQEMPMTPKQIAVLESIEMFGGPLSTLQLATLLWPPSLERKLAWWRLAPETVAQLLAAYPAQHLNERVELAKWLLKISADQPALFAQLHDEFQAGARVAPEVWIAVRQRAQLRALRDTLTPAWQRLGEWLLTLIDTDLSLPEAFVRRVQLPSEFVSTACKQHLRLLFDAGYIEPDEQPSRTQEGRKPLLWYMTKQGRDWLARYWNVSIPAVDWKPKGTLSSATLVHRLENDDVRISFMLAADRHGWTIKRWLHDDQLRQIHSQKSERVAWKRPKDLQDPNSELIDEEGSAIADHYFWLDSGKNWHHFIEYDRGTKTGMYREPDLNDFARKIRAITAYYKSGRYAARYPQAGKSMRVLTITTSETRLQNLKAITEAVVAQMSGDDKDRESGLMRYWLTTADQIAPTWQNFFCHATVLKAPIWVRAGQSDRRPLIW